MRVLHVLPSLDQAYGGPVRLVLDLSAWCLPLGLDSEVLGLGDLNMVDNPLPVERIHLLPTDAAGWRANVGPLGPWLRERLGAYDGVVLHGAWTQLGRHVARECRRQGIPYGAFPHGMLEPWAIDGQGRWKSWKKRIYWALVERHVFQNAACVFFTTERERDLANSILRFPERQAILAVYGLPPTPVKARRPERADLAALAERPYALFFGRVHPKKNAEFLIRVWAEANPPDDWRLAIVGPAEAGYGERLRKLARDLHVAERVVFVDFVGGDDKRFLLQNARWFLLPSKQENFGIAVLEALAHGCPVAISDRVYLAEAFRPESEILPLTTESWKEFLGGRMADDGHRADVLNADRTHLAPRFNRDHVAREWARVLTEELGPHAGA